MGGECAHVRSLRSSNSVDQHCLGYDWSRILTLKMMPNSSNHNDLALAGASLIVTRPAASAAALVRGARARGARVIRLPGMRLRGIDDKAAAQTHLDEARQADCWIFTSPPAVLFALSLMGTSKFPTGLRIFAVGAGTARALARHGIDAIAPVQMHNSEGLLGESALADVSGQHVVLIDAPGGRDLLAPSLRDRGASVERIAVYERVPPHLTPRYLNGLRSAERPWITLLSSSLAMSNLLDALPSELSIRWRKEALVVSSGRLLEQARQRGFSDTHEARSALPRDLLDCACQVLGRHRL